MAEYLAEKSPTGITFAIAGRSMEKLKIVASKLKNSFGVDIDCIVADSKDEKSLDAMTLKANVVITTVGPYAKYGFPLVDACIRQATDYVDITGEPNFIRQTSQLYHESALKKGVRIVHSTGFDSIPSDLGAFILANHFKEKGLETANIRMTINDAKGGVSGGTIASACTMAEMMTFSDFSALARDADYLAVKGTSRTKNPWNGTILHYDKGFKKWQSVFVMEGVNMRMVRRSSSLLGYGPEFQYCEGFSTSNFVIAFIAAFLSVLLYISSILLLSSHVRNLVAWVIPPGTGPSEATRKKGFFDISLIGEAKTVFAVRL